MFKYTLSLTVTFLAARLLQIQASSVFVEDPGPRHVISPVGSRFQLNCSVAVGYLITWAVSVPILNRELISDGGRDEARLNQRGIIVRVINNHSSQLIVNPTVVQLVSYADCIAEDVNDGTRTRSQRVNVTIYGPPSPLNVMLTPLTVNFIRISWSSPPTPPGVTLYFNLTIFNLNSSSSEPVLMRTDIQTQHFIFTDDNRARSCDVYSFQVTARNDAGIGNPSEIITGSLPSLPDISAVEDSLQHSLAKANGSVTLRVQFNEATTCPEYPVMKYTLVLEDSEGNRNETSLSLTGNRSISGLMENVHYTYYIVAVNIIGNNTSSSRSMMTTDVQSVTVSRRNNGTYSIQCSYITGSDARGCVYILVSGVEGVGNITGTIERTNSEGLVIELHNASCYSEVLAYDWERDNTTGSLPIRGQITSLAVVPVCPTLNAATIQTELSATSIAFIVLSLVLLFCVVPITFACGYLQGSRRKTARKHSVTELDTPVDELKVEDVDTHRQESEGINLEQNQAYEAVKISGSKVPAPEYAEITTLVS